MQFDETLRYLLSLGHETLAIKLGLRNTELLLAALDNPQNSYPSIQIAGTNGKGSTAVILDSICDAAGIKTGLYTSPHLVSLTERVKIGGLEISQQEFAQHAAVVRKAAEDLLIQGQIEALPTFFEQVTAIAFSAFKAFKVKLAILETGLGGRLDATTVARAELIAITSIDLDHEEYLGETLESIAREKAAVIRHGASVIVAPQAPAALDVILRHCASFGIEPSTNDWAAKVDRTTADGRLCVTFETQQDLYEHVCPGLRGRHQVTNAAVAIRLAESLRARGFSIPRSAITEGIEKSRHPGRLELWDGRPSFLFDGAHNPAGTQALREYLEEFVTVPITLVFGAMRDKNLKKMATNLFSVASRLVLTQPDNPRAASVEMLAQVSASVFDTERIVAAGSVRNAIRIAKELASSDGLICVTGSLYLIGEVQSILKEMTAAKVPLVTITP